MYIHKYIHTYIYRERKREKLVKHHFINTAANDRELRILDALLDASRLTCDALYPTGEFAFKIFVCDLSTC